MKRGVLITILILVIILISLALVAGFIYMQFTREPFVAQGSYLKIDLSGEIVDNDTSALSNKYTIRDLWYHIRRAKVDERIEGIVLKISFLNSGLAKIEDTGRMIADFRKSGKKVFAFVENGGLKEYFLATFADRVYAFKGRSLFLNGLAAEAIFLKKTFSKLGIKAEFYHIGDYKTAANMFTEDKMTPYHRESLQVLLDDIFESTLDKIAANRGIDKKLVRDKITESPFIDDTYIKEGLVDRFVYEDEILQDNNETPRYIDFHSYSETSSPSPYIGSRKIAVIFASGEIRSGSSGAPSILGGEVMGSDTVAAQLKRVRKNPGVKAVVLRVDSPGGSPFASDVIRREIELMIKKKPLVISMSDLAASGGYQISIAASKIMALPQTITGSIGVLGGKFVMKDLYEKVGIKKNTVRTTPHADMFSDYREFTKVERERYVGFMQYIYDNFVKSVAEGRGMEVADVEKIAQGRVWSGHRALEINLVDSMGGLLDAIDEASNLAGLGPHAPVGVLVYPRKQTIWDLVDQYISVKATTSISLETLETKLKEYKQFFPALLVPYRINIE